MNLYQPTITGSLKISGSVEITGSLIGSAVTASYATNLTVSGTITAQTLVVQTVTSSVSVITGSTNFGSLSANTHTFTGSMNVTGSVTTVGGLTVSSTANAGVLIATNSTSSYSYIDFVNNGASGKTYEIGVGGSGVGAGYANNLYFDLVGVGNIITLTSGRNVGIGTSSPNIAGFSGRCITLESGGSIASVSSGIELNWNGSTRAIFGGYSGAVYIGSWTNENFELRSNGSIRATITSGGYLKAAPNGTYIGSSSPYHEFNSTANNNPTCVFTNYAGTGPYGIEVNFQNADPNNATQYMFGAYATSPSFVWIYRIWSNGTVSARSDARWKKNIETTRSGYLEDLCKLRVVKYNWYNNEDDAPKELGLIAQEVEEVFPNLIQYDKVTTKKQVEQEDGTFVEQNVEDGESRSIKVSVLPYMLLKAIQELKADNDAIRAELAALKS